MVSSPNEKIKTFIQKTLGCNCPEEVFHHIDCQSHVPVNKIVVKNRINIGNRLLIYVIEVSDNISLQTILPLLLHAGQKERDEARFNRFRLVLVTDRVHEVKRAADEIFKWISKDEKIHLHIIHKENVPDFSSSS
jgi:hypothetical protein